MWNDYKANPASTKYNLTLEWDLRKCGEMLPSVSEIAKGWLVAHELYLMTNTISSHQLFDRPSWHPSIHHCRDLVQATPHGVQPRLCNS